MRKAFNFYKSYFDVYNELSDKDKILFMDALLNKQFKGIDTELKGMAKFAYLSQKHSIDAQVKGWEDKMKIKLNNDPSQGGSVGGIVGGSVGGSVQEKEKEKVQEKEEEKQFDYLKLFNEVTKRNFKVLDSKARTQLNARLKEGFTIEDIETAIINCMKDEYHINNPKYLTPEFITRSDKLQKYLNAEPKTTAKIETAIPFI